MRKRKRRIPCRIEGCETPIMFDRLMCRPCWMTLPSGVRRKHQAIWRELRPFIRRSDNTKLSDAPQVLALIKEHRASCTDCTERANNIRTGKAIQPDPESNEIKQELERMGL